MAIAINLISTLSILAPLLIGAIFYRSLLRASEVIFFLVLFTALSELAVRYFAHNGINNLFLFHLYSWIEFYLIAFFYYRLHPHIRWKRLFVSLSAVFTVLSLISLLFFQSYVEFNSFQRVLEALLVGIILIRYLAECIQHGGVSSKDPFFIQTAGFLIYFSGTLFLFSLGSQILTPNKHDIWLIHGVFNILLNISFTFTLWKARIR